MAGDGYLNTRDLASRWGVTIRQVARLAKLGRITPDHKCEACGNMSFSQAEVQRYEALRGK